jgi:hypothetical protein
MAASYQLDRAKVIKSGLLAGVAGGGAEILWIMAVAALTNLSAVNVSRRIGASFGIETISSTPGVLIGVTIHMALAVALGIAVAIGCHALASRWLRGAGVYLVVSAALIGVWAFNFLLLLPLINPAFVDLVPYPISFISKLIFGLAAAEILRRGNKA